MVARHLLRLGFLILLAPELGKARGVLTIPGTKVGGRSGLERRGAAAFVLLPPAVWGCSALSGCLKARLWDGPGEGGSQIRAFGNIPCPLEPPRSQLSFPPRCNAARSLTEAP